jgi:release factor glutamine methyltransferase
MKFDLIISNPPYIPGGEIQDLQPEVRDYEPRSALDGGQDGLDVIRRVAREAIAFMAPEGRLMMEFGDGQAEAVCKIFQEQGWVAQEVAQDYSGRPRILIAHRAIS